MSSKRIFGIISKKEAQIPNVEPNIYKISEENGLKIDFFAKKQQLSALYLCPSVANTQLTTMNQLV